MEIRCDYHKAIEIIKITSIWEIDLILIFKELLVQKLMQACIYKYFCKGNH